MYTVRRAVPTWNWLMVIRCNLTANTRRCVTFVWQTFRTHFYSASVTVHFRSGAGTREKLAATILRESSTGPSRALTWPCHLPFINALYNTISFTSYLREQIIIQSNYTFHTTSKIYTHIHTYSVKNFTNRNNCFVIFTPRTVSFPDRLLLCIF